MNILESAELALSFVFNVGSALIRVYRCPPPHRWTYYSLLQFENTNIVNETRGFLVTPALKGQEVIP